ncbi:MULTISPECIES: LysR family transcriptional regulator [Variovorax]|jgi:LysR family transcriptional regulator, transcriptional activator for dmlA|uniref:LysR family transcriptional regulator n=1 Tax=Variovorax TaxID=34072 RepID=UPI00086CDAD3|nr:MULTISPECIES: LysR family transcriptional regulator [Variovorax]MBN8758415.1 LysR family transcriptional regulator [Variovorax sp.]ODU12524.1 MAG: LysR family transcriptional regulator [Variovorax sp. SCN 67-85]ODV18072.1 MAG: LysR family transcriptional regulator [Variovorax sp. SCN 67-20]OJZ05979.1 MAG: LysR family transcriptional regulator [Variovorax sp. 67-131]UKI08838.1 LysR family transcriptional regulator [Variovorax paradoxus]
MTSPVQPADLGFFSALAACGSLSAAARELGISTPAVSKRLSQMETRLGVTLVNRTTRRMSLTPEGELYVAHARRILGEIDDMAQLLGGAKGEAQGLLRVNATLGFGRSHVAPLISKFVRKHPQVEVQLQLSVNPPPLTDDAFDVCIRFGAPPEARVIARRIASNRRLLCASPAYLARAGQPRVPNDLAHHRCIGIRQGDEAYGMWRLSTGRGAAQRTEAVKTRGALSTNDGEIAVNWALEGHGILIRAEWDIARYLRSGRLVQVLANYRTPDADIYAVYPQRHQLSARVRTFVDFIAAALGKDAAEPSLNRR